MRMHMIEDEPKPKRTIDPERLRARLEQQLLQAIAAEKRAGTRVKRAATLLQKWQKARRRIERRIGAAEVQRIVTRLNSK